MGSHSEEIQNCLWLQTWLDVKTEYLEASWSASPPHTLWILLAPFLRWAPIRRLSHPTEKRQSFQAWKFPRRPPRGHVPFTDRSLRSGLWYSNWTGLAQALTPLSREGWGQVIHGPKGHKGEGGEVPKREEERHFQKTGDGDHSPYSSLKRKCSLTRDTCDHMAIIHQGLRECPRAGLIHHSLPRYCSEQGLPKHSYGETLLCLLQLCGSVHSFWSPSLSHSRDRLPEAMCVPRDLALPTADW